MQVQPGPILHHRPTTGSFDRNHPVHVADRLSLPPAGPCPHCQGHAGLRAGAGANPHAWRYPARYRAGSAARARAHGQLVGKLCTQPWSNPLETRQKSCNIAAAKPGNKHGGMFEVGCKPHLGHCNGDIGQIGVAECGTCEQLSQNAPHFLPYPQLPLRWAR